jgi:hypothetical protein
MAKFEEMVVIDTHKGDMVAKYIARYLSENPCCTHENICRVLESFPRQSCNFLIFALLWFKKLKQIKKPDYQFSVAWLATSPLFGYNISEKIYWKECGIYVVHKRLF